jgi:tetratricopeptide (TPR) repeat protein
VYHAGDRLDEAGAAYRAALAADPRLSEAWINLGNVLREQACMDDALAAYQEAQQIEPDNADAHFNSALPLLLKGELEDGFRAYEWRLRVDSVKFARRHPGKELLADLNVKGRTILLQAEQGLGDTIQLCRYAPLLADAGARVILEVPRSMLRLFGTLPGRVILHVQGAPLPDIDAYLPLMSLPHLFGTTLASIPSRFPYLFAEPQACARWRERIGSHGFKIGITWQGNPDAAAEKGRSAPLVAFAPLAAITGVRLISLQKTHGLDQLDSLPAGMQVETLGDDFDTGPDAFTDTTGVMMNLDLIVTVDTSIGHLAGALGRPVWIALQKVPHWVWMLERSDSPWYQSVRLFRQAVRSEWDVPFAAMAKEIENMKGQGHGS